MDTWIWVVVALLLGVLLGGVGFYLYARRRWADAVRAEELQQQLDSYKQDVSDHFVETAELVNNLTRSYKAVFDHLEHGAYRLVDEETLRKQLGDVEAGSVRLEYIGRRNKAAVLGTGATTEAPRASDQTEAGPAEEVAEPAATEDRAASEEPTGWTTTGTDSAEEQSTDHDEPADSARVYERPSEPVKAEGEGEDFTDDSSTDSSTDPSTDSSKVPDAQREGAAPRDGHSY